MVAKCLKGDLYRRDS